MAHYLITEPCYVEGVYRFADPRFPLELTVADDTPPSRRWKPLDAAATKALETLTGKKAHAVPTPKPLETVAPTVTQADSPAAAPGAVPVAAHAQSSKRRVSEKEAV